MEIFKHPAFLIGAVVLGLLVLLGRRGGGGDGGEARLQAAIQSQDIATRGNVAVTQASAVRDVELARAGNERMALRSSYALDVGRTFAAARASSYQHVQAMRQFDVAQDLGQREIGAGREVALAGLATQAALADRQAHVRELEIATGREVTIAQLTTGERLAGMAGQLQRDLAAAHAALMTNPAAMAHVERLATIDVDRAKALAEISAETTKQLAVIQASSGAIDKIGGVLSDVLGGVMGGGGGGKSGGLGDLLGDIGGDFLGDFAGGFF